MIDEIGLLGLIAGIAVATSFFLASYFLFVKDKDHFENRLIGFLFIAIGLRIAKSIVFFIFHSMAPFGLAIGFIGLASIGPLLYLYVKHTNNNEKRLNVTDSLHGIIPIVGFGAILFTNLTTTTYFYKSTTALLFIYLIIVMVIHLQNKYNDESIKKWNLRIIISVSIVFIAFVYQHLTEGVIDYAIGAALASLPIYYLFMYALKSPVVFNKPKHKQVSEDIIAKVEIAFSQDHIYLKPSISLLEFSETLKIPSYLVTKAVKQLYGKSFPESINYFRIEAVKEKLQGYEDFNTKIEALAYEVGFNSPSVFYAVFKKATGLSPKKFNEKHAS